MGKNLSFSPLGFEVFCPPSSLTPATDRTNCVISNKCSTRVSSCFFFKGMLKNLSLPFLPGSVSVLVLMHF